MRMEMLKRTPLRIFDVKNGQVLVDMDSADLSVSSMHFCANLQTFFILSSGQHKIILVKCFEMEKENCDGKVSVEIGEISVRFVGVTDSCMI